MNVGKKLIIWGTGDDCKSILKRYPILNLFVLFFVDSNEMIRTFYGKKVIAPSELYWNESMFVIIATRRYYDEIADVLREYSLKYGMNFSGYQNAWNLWLASFEDEMYAKRISVLQEKMVKINKWFPNMMDKMNDKKDSVYSYILEEKITAEELIVRCCCEEKDNIIELAGNVKFEFSNIKDFVVIIEEILINEDYYFETLKESPLIIDVGANIGLAIYYFKTMYPSSRIVAFEPMPLLYDIINRNIERNNWRNIEVYPYAVDDVSAENCVFYIQESGLAGSIEKRNQEGVITNEIKEISVNCVCLSRYISEPVEYLKIDIEGSETKVLVEIESKLNLVKHLFIEFHEGQLKGNNFLGRIVSILEQKGFIVNVSKSLGSSKSSIYKPMNYVGKRISEVLWAKKL